MSSKAHTEQEVRRLGSEFGHDLAAALMLASTRAEADRALKKQMAGIVLRQIEAAVCKLEDADLPAELIAAYEQAARLGVRAELMKSQAIAGQLERRAA